MDFTPDQMERYSRQFVLSDIGREGQQKLLSSRVLVIGAGGLGSPALMYLAAAGIGTIGIADGDKVELSNLHRQVIHDTSKLGWNKAESAADRIHQINPDVKTIAIPHRITREEICNLILEYDFIVDAVDTFGAKLMISDACVRMGKPFSHAGIVRFGGQAMTYVPGKGPCLRCIVGDEPDPNVCETCVTYGVLGAAIGVLGSIQATEAIKFLLGKGELLTDRMLFWDGLAMEIQVLELGGVSPHCPTCNPTD